MTDILQAARSYYGLADTESCTTQLFTNQAGQTCIAFEIPLSNEDFTAIVERMKAMQQPDTQPDTAIIEGPTVEAMREAYNALSKAEKGRYGSFARYMADWSLGIVSEGYIDDGATRPDAFGNPGPIRKVAHLNVPEEPEPVSMEAVWLDAKDCSQAQMMHASDADLRSGRHLIQWAMLTDEQKQKAKESGK